VARAVIGVDIGTHAVRAAEVCHLGGERLQLRRFGQVALPVGAVAAGEVRDAVAVGAALRRLWEEVPFSTRRVVVGVGSSRVVVRPAELPAMPEEELAAALRFEAGELIPIPLDDAELDFQVVGEQVGDDGERRAQLLLAAAHRSAVALLLEALALAGLRATTVDVAPVALVRALSRLAPPVLPDGTGPEALVALGAGVTVVTVHEEGTPRFVRITSSGTDAITEALGTELGLSYEEAEDVKRRQGHADAGEGRAARIVAERVGSLVEEVRGSLEFYASQPGAVPVSRVVLTGGGSLTSGVAAVLAARLRVPVETARMLERLEVRGCGLEPADLERAAPVMAVAVGLALGGLARPGGHRLNLLPASLAAERRARGQAVGAGVAIGVLAVALFGAYLLRGAALARVRSELGATDQANAALSGEVARLAPVGAADAAVRTASDAVVNALQGDVDVVRVLSDLASTEPRGVYLTSLTISTAATPTAATSTAGAGATTAFGSVNLSAIGPGQRAAAMWLRMLGADPTLTDVYLTTSTRSAAGEPTTFGATAALTPAARADRLAAYGAEPVESGAGRVAGSGRAAPPAHGSSSSSSSTNGGS